ncbi:MAG: hypothetical protein K6T83_18350, partial [Alicyclobacillus sp.]|nr:hypothetical protein [Alicyclobacillus sp.]
TPYVYPTPEGNVQIEWSIGKVEWSMAVNLSTYRGRLHGLWMDSGQDVEAEYNLALHSDREKLFSTLLLLSGPTLWNKMPRS